MSEQKRNLQPYPFTVPEGQSKCSHVRDETTGEFVCTNCTMDDAQLFAAAPELYEACDECLHALRSLIVHGELSDGSIDYLEKKLNTALNKADG